MIPVVLLIIYQCPYSPSFFSFSFRSLIYQLQELVESRCNNDLCTAVALFAQFGIIVCDRIVLATSGSRKARLGSTPYLFCNSCTTDEARRHSNPVLLRILVREMGTLSVLPLPVLRNLCSR